MTPDIPKAVVLVPLVVFGGFCLLFAFALAKAAKQGDEDSGAEAWLREREAEEAYEREQIAWREPIESFEYREPDTGSPELNAAIVAWRDQVPPVPKERMWREIEPQIPRYPRKLSVTKDGAA